MCRGCYITFVGPRVSRGFRVTPPAADMGFDMPAYGQFVVDDNLVLNLSPDLRGYYPAVIQSDTDRMFLYGKVFSKDSARQILEGQTSLTSALTEDDMRALIAAIDASSLPESFSIDALEKILEEFHKPRLVRVNREGFLGVEVWIDGYKVVLQDSQSDQAVNGVSFSRARVMAKLAIMLHTGVVGEELFSHMMRELESGEAFAALPMATPPTVEDMIMRACEAMLEHEGAVPSLQDLLGAFGIMGDPSGFSGRPPEDDFGRLFNFDELRRDLDGLGEEDGDPGDGPRVRVTVVQVRRRG